MDIILHSPTVHDGFIASNHALQNILALNYSGVIRRHVGSLTTKEQPCTLASGSPAQTAVGSVVVVLYSVYLYAWVRAHYAPARTHARTKRLIPPDRGLLSAPPTTDAQPLESSARGLRCERGAGS
jgi:hypothetical protein